MTIYKTYKGTRLDLQYYKGRLTQGFVVSVFDEDGTDFDLSNYQNIVLEIADKQHGTILLTFEMDDGDGSVSLASPIDNDVYFYLSGVILNTLRKKEYYHECYGVLSNLEKELIFHGVGDLI